MKLLLLGLLSVVFLSCSNLSEKSSAECFVKRAALDVGSGSTKLKVASVDICKNEIAEILFSDSVNIEFKESLAKSSRNVLGKKIYDKAIRELKAMRQKAISLGASEIVGVATSVFRKAGNGRVFIDEISVKTGIPIKVISNEQEAQLAYWGAIDRLSLKEDETVVWDIGGGSMQMITKEETQFPSYLGEMASVGFKEMIIEKLQKKSVKSVNSPNPLGPVTSLEAVKKAKDFALKDVSASMKNKIAGKTVIGVGGVHYYSIRNQVGSDEYSSEDIDTALQKRASLSDKEIDSKYASTEISNLALVTGFMKALKIDKVKAIKVNLADALLVKPSRVF
ncbi:MAG: hypothetical protein VX642_06815 [Bdellovibrionota bacterium]|nr:hypothetical protein [Bdellovibrionota bacterium]